MRRGSPWHPPLSTPHSLISANQDSKYDPFFCSIMHTPADPAVAAPRADGARADGARADGAERTAQERTVRERTVRERTVRERTVNGRSPGALKAP